MLTLCHSLLAMILYYIPHTTYLKTIVRLSPYHPSPSSTLIASTQTILLNTLVPSQSFYRPSYTTSIVQSLLEFLFETPSSRLCHPDDLSHLSHLVTALQSKPLLLSLSTTSLVNAPSPFPRPPHTQTSKPHPGPTCIPCR